MSHVFASEPNIVHVTPDDILREVEQAMDRVRRKYQGMAFITLLGPRNDASKLACLTTEEPYGTSERLRNGLAQMKREGGRIVRPRG